MKLGAAYYPEHERPEQWPIDYKKIVNAGICQIRIAEFAWSVLEPEEGRFCWNWLDEAIDVAQQQGLEVVLCTPTACPPVWLTENYPDVLPVHKSGRTVGFGARQHRSYFSADYNRFALRIVAKMAERYGKHPNVVAWQLDNEFGGETKYDVGGPAKQAFHRYLAEKYGTIQHLNERWGTVFWSQRYSAWSQIPLPAPISADVHMWHHPSLELEFARFSSEGIVHFAQRQAEIIASLGGEKPITTNAFMFRWGDNIDWSRLFASLDVVGMDIYSDRPHEIAFYADACRSVLNKPFWMMEYGTGATELERDMRLVQEHGCSRFFLFKAKPFPWGQEQGAGQPELLTLTGEPSRNYEVVKHFAPNNFNATVRSSPAPVGLYYDFDSSWAYQLAVADRLAYPDYMVDTVYQTLYDAGCSVDILYTPESIGEQSLIIVPLHILYDAALEERLTTYVQGGGHLIATSDLFRKNEMNVFLTKLPRLYTDILGWQENNFIPDVFPEDQGLLLTSVVGAGKVSIMGRKSSIEDWASLLSGFRELLSPHENFS